VTTAERLFEPRNARTDEQGLRFYEWQGVQYPSVTTIRRLAGVPFPLMQWTITQVVNRAVDQLGDLNRIVNRDDEDVRKEAKTWLRKAAIEERDRAASIGKRIHAAATDGLLPGKVPLDIAKPLRQYYDFLDDSGIEVLATEKQVFNLTLGYAGSFDILGRLKSGHICVIDIKSGKNTYAEHALQVCAYALGEFIGENDVVDARLTSLLHDASRMGLLHLREDGWAWEEVRVDRELVDAFRGLLAYAKWAHANPKVDSLLRDRRTGQVLKW
jgi:hypothetical protein